MKKKYENPITLIVKLNGEAVCLLVGSGDSPNSSGDGSDLTKDEGDWDDDLWDD